MKIALVCFVLCLWVNVDCLRDNSWSKRPTVLPPILPPISPTFPRPGGSVPDYYKRLPRAAEGGEIQMENRVRRWVDRSNKRGGDPIKTFPQFPQPSPTFPKNGGQWPDFQAERRKHGLAR